MGLSRVGVGTGDLHGGGVVGQAGGGVVGLLLALHSTFGQLLHHLDELLPVIFE